jgi:hypothetical protein
MTSVNFNAERSKLTPVNAIFRAVQDPAASSFVRSAHDHRAVYRLCACDAINRLPRERLRDGGKCESRRWHEQRQTS